MKLETRGKYPGVKVHLDEEECKTILNPDADLYYDNDAGAIGTPKKDANLAAFWLLKMLRKEIIKLQKQEPHLLEERSPEQIAAILVKETEKAQIQLERLKAGSDWKKIDRASLKEAFKKHLPDE